LGGYIKLGKGEDLSGGRKREGILADAFESLVGAIHISGGIRASRAFVLRQLKKEIKRAAGGNSIHDYKSELQEITQRDLGQIPKYRVINTIGPDHDKTFEVEVRLKGVLLGKGKGKSKKSSEQSAAEQGLLRLTSKGWEE
jgi:ribonuclease-3